MLTSGSQFHGFWQKILVQVVRDTRFSHSQHSREYELCVRCSVALKAPGGLNAVVQADTAHAGGSYYRKLELRKPQAFTRRLPASLPSLCPAGEHYLYYPGQGASLPSA